MPEAKERVVAEVERAWEEEIAFLQSLVHSPSTLFNEAPVQQIIARKMRDLGLKVDMFEADVSLISSREGYSPVEWGYRGRPQVVGVLQSPASRKGRSLVLNGHADVVSAEPSRLWSYDPWGAEIVNDRLYGRGAADMKAGLAAILYALSALRRAGVELGGDLIVQSVIEEECSGNGTLSCLERGYVGDAALIAECTDQQILMAELGVLWLRTVVTGTSGHAESASTSVNAIEKAFTVIQALKELECEWNLRPHPAFVDRRHPINFNTGMIRGGEWPSNVPAECEFVTRLAFYPGIKPHEAKKQVMDHLKRVFSQDPWLAQHPPHFSWYGHHDEGVVFDPEEPFLRELAFAHEQVTGRPAGYSKVTACTDARFWPLYYGRPATCYGPRGGNMHSSDEYVELPSVLEVTKAICVLILDWCGVIEK